MDAQCAVMSDNRKSLKVSEAAHAALQAQTERMGQKHYWVASRVLEWFGQQDEEVQATIVSAQGEPKMREVRDALDRAIQREHRPDTTKRAASRDNRSSGGRR